MISFGKQSANRVHADVHLNFFTGGTIAHVDVVRVFPDGFAEVFGEVDIH